MSNYYMKLAEAITFVWFTILLLIKEFGVISSDLFVGIFWGIFAFLGILILGAYIAHHLDAPL